MNRLLKTHRNIFLLGISLIFLIWLTWYYQHRSHIRAEQRLLLLELQEAGYQIDQFPPDSFAVDCMHRLGRLVNLLVKEPTPLTTYVELLAPKALTSEQFSHHARLLNQLEYDVGLTFEACHLLNSLHGLSDSPNLQRLWIEACPNLTDLSSLQGNQTLLVLTVSDCPQFTHLNEFKDSQTLSYIFLYNLYSLNDISFTYHLKNLKLLDIGNCNLFGSRTWDHELDRSVEEYLFGNY